MNIESIISKIEYIGEYATRDSLALDRRQRFDASVSRHLVVRYDDIHHTALIAQHRVGLLSDRSEKFRSSLLIIPSHLRAQTIVGRRRIFAIDQLEIVVRLILCKVLSNEVDRHY